MAAKPFAVGDVLPATTRLRISWTSGFAFDYSSGDYDTIYTNLDFEIYIGDYWDDGSNVLECFVNGSTINLYNNGWISPYTAYNGEHNYVDVDVSALNETQRTVTLVGFSGMSWEDLNAPSGYTITFNSNGGTTISDIEEATELPTHLPTPTKSGYTFVAWYYESNFQTRAVAGATIEEDTTLYAKWHNLGSLFTEIADAIRSKDGTSENIRDVDFGERVKQIQGAIELTQAQYDALETKDANTYYLIVEVE